MKKLAFFVAVLAMAAMFTSCGSSEVRKCYRLTYTTTVLNAETKVDTYTWANADEIDAEIAKLEKTLNTKVKKSVASDHKTWEDCMAANIQGK